MIVVVGGGISGLSTAWYLAKAGQNCRLIDKNPRLGGVIETARWEDCILEGGPDSFLNAKPEASILARELGMEADLIASNDDKRVTYIWKGHRLIEMPDGMMMMVPTKVAPVITTPLLSWPTKMRMGLEYFRRPSGPRPERTVSEFIGEHYGQETVDYLAEPMLSGIYGGDPRALSADAVITRFVEMESKYGSLTRGALEARKKMPPPGAAPSLFRSFKNGLGSLVASLESRIGDRMEVIRSEVRALERTPDGWRVYGAGEWLEASHIVLAVPAYAAGALVAPHDAELARLFQTIDYSSSMTVSLVFRPGRLPNPTGFGFLVPSKERRKLRAVTHVQNKFPHRAPDGYSIIRCFLGGAGKEAVLDESDERILDVIRHDLRDMLGVTVEPDYHRIVRWRKGMAQYTLGHSYRIRQIERRVRAIGNLYLAGNAYSGIGVPDCIRTGKLAAEAIVGALSR